MICLKDCIIYEERNKDEKIAKLNLAMQYFTKGEFDKFSFEADKDMCLEMSEELDRILEKYHTEKRGAEYRKKAKKYKSEILSMPENAFPEIWRTNFLNACDFLDKKTNYGYCIYLDDMYGCLFPEKCDIKHSLNDYAEYIHIKVYNRIRYAMEIFK